MNLTRKIENLDLSSSEGVLFEYRHFFSGAALYVNGKICASLSPAGFALKLPEEIRWHLIEKGDGNEFSYFEKAPVKKEYVALSLPVQDDQARMKLLLNQSIKYVTSG